MPSVPDDTSASARYADHAAGSPRNATSSPATWYANLCRRRASAASRTVAMSELPVDSLSSTRRAWVSVSTRIVVVPMSVSICSVCARLYRPPREGSPGLAGFIRVCSSRAPIARKGCDSTGINAKHRERLTESQQGASDVFPKHAADRLDEAHMRSSAPISRPSASSEVAQLFT